MNKFVMGLEVLEQTLKNCWRDISREILKRISVKMSKGIGVQKSHKLFLKKKIMEDSIGGNPAEI